ncbi:MAG: efflux RND transporter periplasmic adaptor subunit [Clostridium sp.]
MKKAVKIITAAAVLAVLTAMVAPRYLKPKEEAVAALPTVSVQNPQMGSIEIHTALTGAVEPADIVYVIPKVGGEVTETYVKAGDMVTEGQKLCHIDTKQVDGAKINLDTATVSLQDANTNLQRMQVLFDSGDISSQQFEQIQSSAKMAKLQYDAAKIGYDNQMEFSTITAPIGGLVETFDVSVHDNVSQQNVLCVISGKGAKALSFYVTERVVKNLKMGDEIQIEKNGSEYSGVISEVSTMLDSATGLFKVKASLEGADALATGSQVKLYVTSDRADYVMLIPTDAIYYTNGEPKVYVYKDGLVDECQIEVGIYDAEKAEIKSGLTPEDQVIVTWSSELFKGSKVELQEAK